MIEFDDYSEHPDARELNHAAYEDGMVHYSATNYYLAAKSFTEALKYWPEDSQAWFALGNCYDEIGSPRKAEYCFRKTIVCCPEDKLPDTYYNLGNSLFDQDDWNGAIENYQMVPDEHPAYEQASKNLHLAHDLMKKEKQNKSE